jgi:hypothetical protein
MEDIIIQTPQTPRASVSAMDDIIAQNKAQVREVTNIMQKNIERALERDQNLEEANRRASQLEIGADQFAVSSNAARKKYLWKNRKWTMILAIIIVGLIVLTFVCILVAVEYNRSSSSG